MSMQRVKYIVPMVLGLTLLAGLAGVVLAQEEDEAEEATVWTWEDCYACHDEAEAFVNGPHGQLMARAGEDVLNGSCEGCHGPADQHMEEMSADTIIGKPGSDSCLNCHEASDGHLWLAMPAHKRQGVECLDCHYSGHVALDAEAPPDTEWLLQSSAYETCGSCHVSQAAAARRPYAHNDAVGEFEPFECTECHSAHGLERQGRLQVAGDGGACLDCHTDLKGPFIYPHPSTQIGGCASCHEVHGSTNPRMLNRRLVLNLCLECHGNVPAFHDITQARYRNCTSCHLAVHGSNRSPALFEE